MLDDAEGIKLIAVNFRNIRLFAVRKFSQLLTAKVSQEYSLIKNLKSSYLLFFCISDS
jgi:hypothetical protein